MCIVLWEQQVCPKAEQISLQHRPTFSVLLVLHFAAEFCAYLEQVFLRATVWA